MQSHPAQPLLLSPSNTEKMGRLTLRTTSIVCMENNLLLSLVSSRCHLPRDLINRVCHSVGVHELATGSKLLEGHISIFMPRLEIWNVNSIGSPRQITFLGSNLIPNLLFDDKCIFKIPVIPWDFKFLPNLIMLLFKAILVTNLKGFQLMLFPL